MAQFAPFLNIKFSKIVLEQRSGGDVFLFYTDELSNPEHPFEGFALFELKVPRGHGQQYWQQFFPEMNVQITEGL
jgi:hypothetical protein